MKKSGHFKSEIYTLKTKQEKWPKVAFCDMEKPGYDDNSIESLLGYINVSPESSQIIFSAYSAPDPGEQISAGNYVTFDHFWVNNGNDFTLTTGEFKAPFDGTYEFSFSGNSYTDIHVYVLVLKNEAQVHEFFSDKSGFQNLSSTWILVLKAGDKIRLKVHYGKLFSSYYMYRTFTGKLLEI